MSLMPWFPFYVDDFLASPKVRVMDAEEIGVYMLLLCEQHQKGHVEWPDPRKARALKTTDECIQYVLEECFEEESEGVWKNPRLRQIHAEQIAKSKKAARSAKARWDKGSNANAKRTQSERNATRASNAIQSQNQNQSQKETATTAAVPPGSTVENEADDPPPEGAAEVPAYTDSELLDLAYRLLGKGTLGGLERQANSRILQTWLHEGRDRGLIYDAIEGCAAMRDEDLIGWDSAKPGTPMTLKALNGPMTLADQGDGRAQRMLFDVAAEYARRAPPTKGPKARARDSPQHVADLIGRSAG